MIFFGQWQHWDTFYHQHRSSLSIHVFKMLYLAWIHMINTHMNVYLSHVDGMKNVSIENWINSKGGRTHVVFPASYCKTLNFSNTQADSKHPSLPLWLVPVRSQLHTAMPHWCQVLPSASSEADGRGCAWIGCFLVVRSRGGWEESFSFLCVTMGHRLQPLRITPLCTHSIMLTQ